MCIWLFARKWWSEEVPNLSWLRTSLLFIAVCPPPLRYGALLLIFVLVAVIILLVTIVIISLFCG